MPNNPQSISELSDALAPAPRFALPGHRVIALSGRDAVAFAQAQCMNDVEGVAPGRWQWNGWLTPKGRVIALFALARMAADTLWLIVPDADAEALAAALQRYVLRRQLSVALRDDLHASGAFEAPAVAVGAQFAGDEASAVEFDFSGFGVPRTLRIASVQAGVDPDSETRWAAGDLRLGFPRLPASQAEQWTPQQLSLDRIGAFSVKKGCYPGQEIVARTHFLGQAKRGLALFEAAQAPDVGVSVEVGAGALGQVVSTARNGEGHVVLAVLPVERPDAAISASGIALRERALLAGLAR
ncbi:folate-binding protein YgfZ [Lysobacter helvus]|uniref:Folate-binding protein YgfZ n=3 Tax=Lysobacteraceae TaxID=32033 RepID=A0ABN6FWY4_9GAMM|nr:folate-binding protein [Lysobacter caseinilyticus]BCT93449.1 folate-binding protein YgfZ [Lysobacter caseinilyticus]BCT96602.1 folate-binding protein YgfZ [Lysobacter helvus]